MGYDGAAGVEHAMEQGEVEGDAGDTWFSGQGNTYEWYKAGKIRVLVLIGTRTPDLPDVPLLVDLAGNSDDRSLLELFSAPYTIGKPTAVGPKVPADRVAALRAAYVATMQDPAFLADAKQARRRGRAGFRRGAGEPDGSADEFAACADRARQAGHRALT